MKKILFKNILGNFVFGQNFTPINGSSGDKPDEAELKRILEYFKDKRFFNDFYEKNLANAKKAIKDSFTRDILIVQAVSSIDEIGKAAHLLAKRLREWHSFHNPELSRNAEDNESFLKIVLAKKLKGEMGVELKREDMEEMYSFAAEIWRLHELKNKEEEYLGKLMKELCPNLKEVAGTIIGARLISLAGSLKRLSEMPASTIQVLGAEKAMFRHVRNKNSRPPKYGVIHEHPLIMKAKRPMHGKIARTLADKICLAAKVDYFKGEFIGEKLRIDLEEKFK
jgi:nucleolar protein 56